MNRRKVIGICVLIAVVAISVVVYLFDPQSGEFPYPRCMFKLITGRDCPGCGSTRALHALLHGRINDAWVANPAVFAAIPLVGLCLAAEVPGNTRLRRIVFTPAFALALLAATLLWTLARNLL